MIILDGKNISTKIINEYEIKIKMLDKKIGLAVITVGLEDDGKVYLKQKEKICDKLGIELKSFHFSNDVSNYEIIDKIRQLNMDDNVDGILIQLPLPNHLNCDEIINTILPNKDIDGLTDKNVGYMMHSINNLVPCTALGIIDLLNAYNISLDGKNVTIIGRSRLVGKPLIPLLLSYNATVTVCHSKTVNIEEFTKNADIIIIAIGSPKFLTYNMVKEGAIVIDVGINKVDEKLVGDTDFENIKNKCSYITPVPGGVGPMTIAAFVKNAYFCYKLNQKKQ